MIKQTWCNNGYVVPTLGSKNNIWLVDQETIDMGFPIPNNVRTINLDTRSDTYVKVSNDIAEDLIDCKSNIYNPFDSKASVPTESHLGKWRSVFPRVFYTNDGYYIKQNKSGDAITPLTDLDYYSEYVVDFGTFHFGLVYVEDEVAANELDSEWNNKPYWLLRMTPND